MNSFYYERIFGLTLAEINNGNINGSDVRIEGNEISLVGEKINRTCKVSIEDFEKKVDSLKGSISDLLKSKVTVQYDIDTFQVYIDKRKTLSKQEYVEYYNINVEAMNILPTCIMH